MKSLTRVLSLAGLLAPMLAAAADVGVSVSVGEPGFYGQINIGDFPRPRVIYEQPMIIQRGPAMGAPAYLRVPPGHEKHWAKHCHEYGACGRPVYFVRDSWYNDVYVPSYRAKHGAQGQQGYGHPGGEGHPGRGHGNGQGKGKGRGKD